MRIKKSKKYQRNEKKRAQQSLEQIHGQLVAAYQRFDQVQDPALTEACIYEINALRARYDYAFQNLKRLY